MILQDFPLGKEVAFSVEQTTSQNLSDIEKAAQRTGAPLERIEIGRSRAGRPMWGLKIGRGPRNVSVTAGAHADEPVGPMTALALAAWLAASDEAAPWLQSHTFYLCPQVNPDGAETNRPWFRDPLDPIAYMENVVREAPGEDIEFGYPQPSKVKGTVLDRSKPVAALRPENQAVADFLESAGEFVYHASLHGMGITVGAWFLIGADWAQRSEPFRNRLTECAKELGFGQFDIDRKGEKGFSRIAKGYSTTPTSPGMRKFFLEKNEPETAELFHLNSMEFVQALGGDPLVMVSELPLFTIGLPYKLTDPPTDPPSRRLRPKLREARLELAKGNLGPVKEALAEFKVTPTPLLAQVKLQGRMIFEALQFLMDLE